MFQLVGGFVIRTYGNLKSCLAKLTGEIRDPNVISQEGIEVNDSGYQMWLRSTVWLQNIRRKKV